MTENRLAGERRDIPAASNIESLSDLKGQGYNVLVDMTCVDYLAQGRTPRFDVIYRLMKLDAATGMDSGRIEAHCAVGPEAVLRTAKDLWPAADWLEREVWDMFGVSFVDRPGIKRLLLYEEFEGHPLRKDYPISRRQPLIGPRSGDKADSPSFNLHKPSITGQ
ncbi:MAG: NADH-quinone oxidoreductase subunit C [Elusimicrobiota bacterium]